MDSMKIWRHWAEVLPDYFKKYACVELEFLKEVIEIEPNRYGGTDRIFYYKGGCFHTAFSHWDGGNMWGNVTCDRTPLTKEALAEVLDSRKTHILSELAESERPEFEHVFNEVKHFLLSQPNREG